ncbi:Na+/H+ antiporter NhaD/arsenite permease-like protein [Salirhabdus euzebyi]|uniref:Na+/H+ antiporter NhaD/arsenite permease-like protein n=1 Tax=Salirhabdus euzebyi TaxID=394506 RepID=A0A841Q1A7_9BACI|nr:ArsB/NhaD family transporter [Salirhabdus euzebyi]MBB6451893.1 Na+/H+ antiporter NhaD/arsenite permease-like protein [Salirhabdus euzebyi]
MEAAFSIAIFLVSYIFIIMEKVNRALVALTGGVLMLCIGIYDWNDAFYSYIDWHTITLLFSMMVLVSITQKTGFFEYIALLLAQKVKGEPVRLLIVISCLTALGSALLDNVTTVLLFVPVLLNLTSILQLPAFPYLISIIFSSNIGGAATLIGDPPNIMIGQAVEHLTFTSFLKNMAPVVFIIFICTMFLLYFLFRKSLKKVKLDPEKIKQLKPEDYLKKTPLLYKSLGVLGLTIVGFLLHPILHVELTTVAVCGALLLLLLSEKDVQAEKIFQEVEWLTLFFFIGLFILVGGLQATGVIDEVAKGIIFATEGDLPKTALIILWISGIFSGIVDNIPFVAAMIPIIQEFKDYGMMNLDPLWWALALGACLGGNGTLVGASANVVVAGIAATYGKGISFLRFMKYGFPIVIFSLIICTVYIFFRYLIPFMQASVQ